MKYCINELKIRFLLSQNKFLIKIVDEVKISFLFENFIIERNQNYRNRMKKMKK